MTALHCDQIYHLESPWLLTLGDALYWRIPFLPDKESVLLWSPFHEIWTMQYIILFHSLYLDTTTNVTSVVEFWGQTRKKKSVLDISL